MNTPIVELNKVSFRYHQKWILQDVNLHVHEREFACIVGPNGGGKTTLLKLILGLLSPEMGEVRVLAGLPTDKRVRQHIGYMPQHLNYDTQFPMTVLDVVLMGLLGQTQKESRLEEKNRALSALETVGLSEQRHRLFNGLSGGQRQRVLIARALVSNPKLLIFDEPMANIDVEAQENLLATMKELNKRLSILMVSHDYRFVADVVSQVICVNKQVAIHPTALVTDGLLRNVFKGHVRVIKHDECLEEDGHCHKHGHKHD